jgi:arylsulfatase A-like enzyme
MDGFVAVPLPPATAVVADPPLHSYRVGRENRSARVVEGPQRLVRSVPVPPGGGRFETSISPLKGSVSVRVAIKGSSAPPSVVVAAADKWSPVTIDLPKDRSTVDIEETLDAPAGSRVLWADDRIAPARPQGTRPDVVVITLDTVRPDYLTPYSPRETTTPTLAQLAREGTRFDQAISVSSWTMPGHAALFTGEYPDMGLGFTHRLEPRELTLPEIFAAAGYNTHGASGGPFTDSVLGFQQGFRCYLDSGGWKNAADITSWALERVTKSQPGAPLFLFLNYFDAHEPYAGISDAEWHALDSGKAPLTPEKLATIRNSYRDGIRTIDTQLARLFEGFRRSRNWQNTIVVVVGDHGQLLGERGFIGHAYTLDEELLRIPLIVKPAASRKLGRATYAEQFQMTDVFGLTLQLAGIQGRSDDSLSRRVSEGKPVRGLTFASIHHDPTPELRAMPRWRSAELTAVRTDTMKVVRDLEGRTVSYRVGRSGEEVVPSTALSQRLLGELAAFSKRLPVPADSGTLTLPADVRERLRALGYIR